MKKYLYEGKNYEDALSHALEDQNTQEENLIITIKEEKNTLLKKQTIIEVINYNDIINYAKECINEITNLMGLEVNLEVRRRENNITIKIFSDHNAVLIGKNGYTISALQTIIRQILFNNTNKAISITLDVENYKEKREKTLEELAEKISERVIKTKKSVTLDPMSAYERKIIHMKLQDNDKVKTFSKGEEPHRRIVITLK